MKEYRRHSRKGLCIAGVLGLLLLLSGCSPTPPDRASGRGASPALQEDASSGEGPVAPAETQTSPVVKIPVVTADRAHGDIGQVDLYIDATQAMMGFVDTPAISLYTRFLDIVSTSIARSFPDAQRNIYRADIERQDRADALLSQGILSQEAGNPSFYLVQRLTHLPDQVQLAGQNAPQSGTRMNTFTDGYYQRQGFDLPAGTTETSAPITWAVGQGTASGDSVALYLTDLHELQLHTGILTQALRENIFTKGSTVGILALSSEFSGLVPVGSVETIWYEWGALPTGAMGKMLDYGYYTLGIAQDAADRGEAMRPFYLLCVGRSDVVADFLAMVQHQLNVSLSAEPPESHALVYGLTYAQSDSTLSNRVRLTGYSQSGINLNATELSQTGQSYVQIQKANAGDARFVEFTLPYKPNANDPRVGAFTAEDFTLSVQLYTHPQDGSAGTEVTSADVPLQFSIGQNNAEQVDLIAHLSFPQGVLPKGDYQLMLSLTIEPPAAQGAPEWVQGLSSDLTAQQRSGTFDGSKTLELEGFLSALSGLQKAQLKPVPVGSFSFPLYVVVDET